MNSYFKARSLSYTSLSNQPEKPLSNTANNREEVQDHTIETTKEDQDNTTIENPLKDEVERAPNERED